MCVVRLTYYCSRMMGNLYEIRTFNVPCQISSPVMRRAQWCIVETNEDGHKMYLFTQRTKVGICVRIKQNNVLTIIKITQKIMHPS